MFQVLYKVGFFFFKIDKSVRGYKQRKILVNLESMMRSNTGKTIVKGTSIKNKTWNLYLAKSSMESKR